MKVEHILQLKNLEEINVSGASVTASGLATLVRLPKLRVIHASEIKLTDSEKAMLRRVLGRAINFD